MALESSIYANKGLSGLANVGNSCYINTCMQIKSMYMSWNPQQVLQGL